MKQKTGLGVGLKEERIEGKERRKEAREMENEEVRREVREEKDDDSCYDEAGTTELKRGQEIDFKATTTKASEVWQEPHGVQRWGT